MAISNQLKNQHLFWRAGFGPRPEDAALLQTAKPEDLLKKIFSGVQKPAYLEVASSVMDGLVKGIDDIIQMNKKDTDPENKRRIQKQNREGLQGLNLAWFHQMMNTPDQLTEKMALFWHGHFACRIINVYYQQLLLDAIRRNALGNFGDLLREVSQSAAMINFLNNQQNRKKSPNENFAREVMELFTLGRGNYTEQDVKEAARAFTGWGANIKGEFVNRPGQHDTGSKTVLGRTGNFDGDDIIDILLEEKQTARYIVIKIWRFFVNETIADGEQIEWLAKRFYSSGYNIKSLMQDIFSAGWFYEAQNIGAKIKSPVELMVGMRRMVPMLMENEEVQLYLQRVLGQILFYPPNVAGWPGGRQWIDSSSLMLRLRIPRLIADADEFAVKAKDDDDTMGGMQDASQQQKLKKLTGGKVIKASIQWPLVEKAFETTAREKLTDAMMDLLLQTPSVSFSKTTLGNYIDKDSRSNFIKSAIINLMSTPEYQLC
jgi:uncharacterized protein (DUF1800 family)